METTDEEAGKELAGLYEDLSAVLNTTCAARSLKHPQWTSRRPEPRRYRLTHPCHINLAGCLLYKHFG